MRWLARNGFRPFLFDWGDPGPAEAHFRIADYLSQRLRPAFAAVQRACGGGAINLAGYCMGGPIALALAALEAENTGRVVTLGTPWDFRHFPEHDTFRDWLNDGIGLPLPVTLECFTEWLIDNALLHGTWNIGPRTLDLAEISAPVMVIAGTKDNVVPPACALPLIDAIGAQRVMQPHTGHLGVVLGERADAEIWIPVRDFLCEDDG